jgi:Ran-binding protein 3
LQPSVHPDGVTNGCTGQSAEEASSKPKPVFGVTSAPGVGFTGFASFASPFAKVDAASAAALTSSPSFAGPKRSKSPSRGNAFTPYNTANRGFGTPKSPSRRRSTELPGSRSTSSERNSDDNNTRSKREREPRSMSFTEKLLEEQDDDHRDQSQFKINLQEQEGENFDSGSMEDIQLKWTVVFTGEEDERTVFSVRGKLYTLGDQHQWKERGVGPFKLNVRKSDGAGARLGWFQRMV